MDSDLSRPDLAEQGRCLERRDGLAKELHWVRRLVCLGHGILKLLDFDAFPERQDQRAEVAGFGFQLGTKGCLAATMTRPSGAKSTLTMAGFSRKGAWLSLPKKLDHQPPELS
jgi:hypothetical protein